MGAIHRAPSPGQHAGRIPGLVLLFMGTVSVTTLVGAWVGGVNVPNPRSGLKRLVIPMAKSVLGSTLGALDMVYDPETGTVDLRPRSPMIADDFSLWEEGARSLCEQLARVAPAELVRVRLFDSAAHLRVVVEYDPATGRVVSERLEERTTAGGYPEVLESDY